MHYIRSDYKELLNDDKVDAVLISTRHGSHAEIAIEAAKLKKNIFVEKPLALNVDDAKKVVKAVSDNNVILTVGFNRRFAPLAIKAKDFLQGLGSKTITYRVNSGLLPSDHWVNDPEEGGGAIIGEACHFFDFFHWFLDEDIVSVYAAATRNLGERHLEENNLSCTARFSGGSVASLIYTTTGSKSGSKEKIEAFAGGRSIEIDDFKRLTLSGVKTEVLERKIDKGHKQLLEHFYGALSGRAGLSLTAEDGLNSVISTVAALESARSNKSIEI